MLTSIVSRAARRGGVYPYPLPLPLALALPLALPLALALALALPLTSTDALSLQPRSARLPAKCTNSVASPTGANAPAQG